MEQMRKMESVCIGLAASRSAMPCAFSHTTFPRRETSVTAPAIRLSAMLRSTAAAILSSRSEERPTDSGFAVGSSSPSTATQAANTHRASAHRVNSREWRVIEKLAERFGFMTFPEQAVYNIPSRWSLAGTICDRSQRPPFVMLLGSFAGIPLPRLCWSVRRQLRATPAGPRRHFAFAEDATLMARYLQAIRVAKPRLDPAAIY